MSTANRVIKNTFWLYAKMGITMFVSLYTTRIILNALGASDFGVYNIVGGAVAMLGFLNTAMATASQRFMSFSVGKGDQDNLLKIFNVSVVIHVILGVLMALILLVSGYFFFHGILSVPADREYAAYIVYISLIVSTLLTIINVPYDAVMNAHENMKYYAIIGVFESVLKLAVVFACYYTSLDKLIIYAILMSSIPLISLTIMELYCHKHYSECVLKPLKYFDRKTYKEMISFAGWNLLGISGSMIGNYGQNIVINHFFGVLLNAAIGIVNQIIGIVMVFTNNMFKAVNPVIVKKAGSGNQREMIEWSFASNRFSFFLFAWIAIPLCVETDYMLKLWLKEVPDWTVIFVRLQMIRTMIEQLTMGFRTTLGAVGDIKKLNIQTSLLFFLSLFLTSFLFYCGFPPYALYIVMIGIVLLQTIIILRLCVLLCGMTYSSVLAELILPTIVLSVVLLTATIIPSLFMHDGLVRLLVSLSLCWASLLVCLQTFYLKQNEKEKVYEIIRNYLRK